MGKRFKMNKLFRDMTKDFGKLHQERIRKRAIKNPVEAYFLGGFDLLPKEKQEEVKKEFNRRVK